MNIRKVTNEFDEPKYIYTINDLHTHIKLGETLESVYLDFKTDIQISNNSPKKKQEMAEELALDICQFANTWGGVLLIGVKETLNHSSQMKVAQGITGVSTPNELVEFINDCVLPLIYPKDIKINQVWIKTSENKLVLAINISPLGLGIACVCAISPPYTSKFPYRTNYGKKYFHPIEVEKRMAINDRSIHIKLDELIRTTKEVTVFPNIMVEPIDRANKWDFAEINIFLKGISKNEFTLKIGGIDVNIPFGLVKDVWFTEHGKIGIILSTRLILSSDRKSIFMDI